MRNYTPAQYKKAAVIVHGKSERFLASYIYTNLHFLSESLTAINVKAVFKSMVYRKSEQTQWLNFEEMKMFV